MPPGAVSRAKHHLWSCVTDVQFSACAGGRAPLAQGQLVCYILRPRRELVCVIAKCRVSVAPCCPAVSASADRRRSTRNTLVVRSCPTLRKTLAPNLGILGGMTDAAQPWAPLMNMFSPQRRVATDADPQTDNLGSAHQTSVLPTPPLMDMSKQHPTAQGGIPSSLEPDTRLAARNGNISVGSA